MLGLSSPRFAARTSDLEIGFVNLRRIKRTEEALTAAVGKREILDFLSEHVISCVADCLLIPPADLLQVSHIVTTNLWEAYDETDRVKKAYPYVMHTPMGGGLCSQACCFMATALLHRYSRGIYAIPEVTKIAHTGDEINLSVQGLTTQQMRKFFYDDCVRLNTVGETFVPRSVNLSLDKKRLSFAIRSYVLSGVPVLLMVDDYLLKYNKNVPNTYRTPPNEVHCVVINGVNKEDRDKFVIADPSSFYCHPFRGVDIDRIWNSRVRRSQVTRLTL